MYLHGFTNLQGFYHPVLIGRRMKLFYLAIIASSHYSTRAKISNTLGCTCRLKSIIAASLANARTPARRRPRGADMSKVLKTEIVDEHSRPGEE
jgi:hypothetical protein